MEINSNIRRYNPFQPSTLGPPKSKLSFPSFHKSTNQERIEHVSNTHGRITGSANNRDADLFHLMITLFKPKVKIRCLNPCIPLIPSLVPATSPSHLHAIFHSHLYDLLLLLYSTPEPLSEWRLSLELYSVPSTKVPHSDLIPSHFGLLPHLYSIVTGHCSILPLEYSY